MNAPAASYPGRDLEAMSLASNYRAWIARYFAPSLRGTVVEIGAGAGQFSECLLRPGVERLYAVEPAPNLHAQLAARFQGRADVVPVNALLAEALPRLESPVDAFVYCNVLEHVADDFAEVARCVPHLKPGGALCIFVPALPWLLGDFDRSIGHHRRYLPRRLREIAAAAGLVPETVRWFDSAGVLPWLVVMKWLGSGLNPRAVRLYDRWVVPWLSRAEAFVAPPIGKNLLMIAKRPT